MKFWLAIMSKKLIDKFYTDNLARPLHTVVFPVLMGFSMNLPWLKQSTVAFAFVLATLLVNDFVDALIALWQAFAISSFVLLVISYLNGANFEASLGVLLIPVVWLTVLILRRRYPSLDSESNSHDSSAQIVALIILIVFISEVPRNLQESFGFLSAEDNAGWLQVTKDIVSNGKLSLISGFDYASVQYFVKFFFELIDPVRYGWVAQQGNEFGSAHDCFKRLGFHFRKFNVFRSTCLHDVVEARAVEFQYSHTSRCGWFASPSLFSSFTGRGSSFAIFGKLCRFAFRNTDH